METCEHSKTSKKAISREFFGKTFKGRGEVCSECGAILWDKNSQNAFYDWVSKLDDPKARDKFTVQFFLTNKATLCLDKIVKQFPGSDKTMILRALTVIYLTAVAPFPEFAAHVENIMDSEVFKDLSRGAREQRYKVHFKPLVLIDLQSWAKIAGLPPSKFMEEAILRLLSVYIENNPILKEFWKSTILLRLELILKAA
ncbi:MAG: hypothetical protein HY537_12875 [Deltaproteobacteria bacterium]|nr:hypothetical protein [Deltaproteobacteria bacterium]